MCLDLVAEVVKSEQALDRLAIPRAFHDVVRRSWSERIAISMAALTLPMTGMVRRGCWNTMPTLRLPCFETAYFQFNWLTDQIAAGNLAPDTDQFNSVQECLIEAFGQFSRDRIFHFAAITDSSEDQGTAAYLMDCAIQAGHRAQFLDIRDIGVDTRDDTRIYRIG